MKEFIVGLLTMIVVGIVWRLGYLYLYIHEIMPQEIAVYWPLLLALMAVIAAAIVAFLWSIGAAVLDIFNNNYNDSDYWSM